MILLFYIENGMLCVLNEAILIRTHNIPPCYRKIKEILIMPPDLALLSTLIGSYYPCLELIFMVPKVFEPLKFDCIEIARQTLYVCSAVYYLYLALVGWPLRQYFSLYQVVSQREKDRERTDERKKCPNNPHPRLLQVQ